MSADRLLPRWPLPDVYFELRGGTPRGPEGAGARMRLGDPRGGPGGRQQRDT
jgi:hypothetical protein